MRRLVKALTVIAAWSALAGSPGRGADAISIEVPSRTRPVDFDAEVAPLLRANCVACHHAKKSSGGLVLESAATILKGGDQGPAVVPGRSDESLLLSVAAHQQQPVMPPPDNIIGAKPLTPQQLGLLKLWIDQGASGAETGPRTVQFQSLPPGYRPALTAAVTADGQFAACSRGNRLQVYHLPSASRSTLLVDPALQDPANPAANELAHRDLVRCLTFDATGDLLASGSFREVKLWRRPRLTRNTELVHESPVQSVAVSDDGRLAATGDETGRIRIWDLRTGQALHTIAAHTAAVSGMVFSADGGALFSGSPDKSLRAWNPVTAAGIGKPIEGDSPIQALSMAGPNERLLTGTDDGTVRIWDAQALRETATDSGQPLQVIKAHSAAISALATPARDSAEFLSGSTDGAVRRWNAESGMRLAELRNESPVVALAVSVDGRRIAAAGANGAALWDGDGKLVARWNTAPHHTREIARIDAEIAFTKSAVTLAQQDLKSYEGLIRISGVRADEVKKAEEELGKVEKARAEKLAALEKAKAENGKLEQAEKAAADAETAVQVARTVIERAKAIADRTAAQLADAEQALAARSELLKQQEAASAAATAAAKAAPLAMRSLAFSIDGQRLAIGCDDGSLHLYDSESGTIQESETRHQGAIRSLAFNAEHRLLTGSGDRRALLWDVSPQWRLERVLGSSQAPDMFIDRVLSVDFSPDGRLLATGGGIPSRSGELRIWNLAGGQLLRSFTDAHADTVFAVRFSPDGSRFASAGADRFLRVWETASGTALQTLAGHAGHVLGISWKADGKLLASCGADQLIKLWDPETGAAVRTMKGGVFGNRHYKGPVTAVTFIGASEELLAASGDGTVRLHRTTSDHEVMTYGGTKGYQFSAAATFDGRFLITGGSTGQLHIWSGHDARPRQTLEP